MKQKFGSLLKRLGLLFSVPTILALLARWHWSMDLFAHFRVQYVVLLLPVCVVLVFWKQWRWLVLPGVALVWNLILIAPAYLPIQSENSAPDSLRVISANVFTRNRETDKLIRLIEAEAPDLFLVTEVNADWLVALESLREKYPYSTAQSREDNFGMALYSRFPIIDFQFADSGHHQLPLLVARLQRQDSIVTVIGAHPLPPTGDRKSASRNLYLQTLAQLVQESKPPVIVLGDLNTSPWSPYFSDLLDTSKLCDSRCGFGIQPTWPVGNLPLFIPIDHVLVSSEIEVHDRRIGSDIGSDHFPVIVDLSVEIEQNENDSSR